MRPHGHTGRCWCGDHHVSTEALELNMTALEQAEATWKVYVQDWALAYASDAAGEAGRAECVQVFAERWDGRVAPGDARIEAVPCPAVWLRLHRLAGEWKSEELAQQQAEDIMRSERQFPPFTLSAGEFLRLPGFPQIVRHGSPEEQELLGYGTKMLPVEAS
jgi:hypothetical protein